MLLLRLNNFLYQLFLLYIPVLNIYLFTSEQFSYSFQCDFLLLIKCFSHYIKNIYFIVYNTTPYQLTILYLYILLIFVQIWYHDFWLMIFLSIKVNIKFQLFVYQESPIDIWHPIKPKPFKFICAYWENNILLKQVLKNWLVHVPHH